MGYISLNWVNIVQPSAKGVQEEQKFIEHDRVTAAGTMRRYFFGTYWQVTLNWPYLAPANYQEIMGMIINGKTVIYNNSYSGEVGGALTFTGFALHSVDKYVPGASLLRNFTLVLRSV